MRVTDLPVSRGKYYLANTGFPTCDTLLKVFDTILQSGAGSVLGRKLLVKILDSTDLSTSIKAIHTQRIIQSLSHLCMQCGILKWQFCIIVHPPKYNMGV